jgi:hypothetical protein
MVPPARAWGTPSPKLPRSKAKREPTGIGFHIPLIDIFSLQRTYTGILISFPQANTIIN